MSDAQPGKPLRAYDERGRFQDFSTDDFVGKGLNQFKGWLCGAGVRNISIEPDGSVHGASCEQGGILGNIFEPMIFPEKWARCSFAVCSCGADLFVPKVKSEDLLPLLRKSHGHSTQLLERTNDVREIFGLERVHVAQQKQVYWELTHRCNYSCSYCVPEVHNKTDLFRPFVDILEATERILEDFGKGEQLNFIISGGEPTLHPHFLDWVRLLSILGHHVSAHSNGSRMPKYYAEVIKYCDLNLSLHFEFYNSEKFFKVVEAVSRAKLRRQNRDVGHLEVKIMMPAGGYAQALAVEERLRSLEGFAENCTAAVVPIRVGKILDKVDPKYSSNESELFGIRT